MLTRTIPWTRRPPAGTPIDWTNPVVNALSPVDLWVATPQGGVNVVRPRDCFTKMSNVSSDLSAFGQSLIGSGTTSTASVSGYEGQQGHANYVGSQQLAWFVLGYFTGGQSGSYECSLMRVDQDGSPGSSYSLALDLFQTPTTWIVRPLLVTSGTTGWSVNNDVTIGSPRLNALHLIAAVYNPLVSSGIRVYVGEVGNLTTELKNGSSNATGSVSAAGAIASQSMHLVGMAATGVASLKGGLVYGGVSKTACGKNVFDALCVNPWQIFQP